MRKGITPIISIIVLLLITVAIAGAAYTYIAGYLGVYTEKSFTLPTGGAYCDTTGNITVPFVNSGTTTIATTDWTTLDEDPDCTGIINVSGNVLPKAMGNVTVTSCTSGKYTIHMGTTGGTQHPEVTCVVA